MAAKSAPKSGSEVAGSEDIGDVAMESSLVTDGDVNLCGDEPKLWRM